jgi:epoxyqueuosine reductase QueG
LLFKLFYAIIFYMSVTNSRVYEYARSIGIGDIRFAGVQGSVPVTNGDIVRLDSLLEGAKTLMVLFAEYLPSREAMPGHMALSPYYIASDFAYNAAKRLVNFLEENGARAVRLASISARAAALRTGGFIGDNGFYYHDAFGSFTCIQTILADCAEPAEYEKKDLCMHCGECRKGCPSKTVGNMDGCVRQHMHGIVPQNLRGGVYQLFGCEKCQTACPLNSKEKSVPYELGLESLLNGECTRQLKELIGPNMARSRRIISQAALYAANSKAYHLAGKLKELSQTAEEPVRTHALWAYNKLGEKDDNA